MENKERLCCYCEKRNATKKIDDNYYCRTCFLLGRNIKDKKEVIKQNKKHKARIS